MFFHALTFAYGLGFQHLPRDLANVNAWKTMFDPYNICQYFLLKKSEKLLQCKSFSHFFNKKISVFLVIKL